MKLKNIIFTTAIAAVLVSAVGCSKKKFDINANPDDVTDVSVTPSVLLPGALQATSSTIASEYWVMAQDQVLISHSMKKRLISSRMIFTWVSGTSCMTTPRTTT